MIRARVRTGLASLVLGFPLAACGGTAPVQHPADVRPVVTEPTIAALFKDTTVVTVSAAERRSFTLNTPGQRDSLRATLIKQRALWRASGLSDYRFLLRAQCFCPGVRGWLLIEVRRDQPLRAWDRTGKAVASTEWDTFSVEGLYDILDRSAEVNRVMQIAFDADRHFPAYVYTAALQLPDTWSIIEVRGLRPL